MIDLRRGDCIEVMESMPDDSVDMVLCDLPYGTTRNHWDSIVPLDALWGAYRRIVKGGGAIALFAQPPFTFVLASSNLEDFRYQWIWVKNSPTGFLNAGRSPLKSYEEILVFCDRAPPYHPRGLRPGRTSVVHGPSSNYGSYSSRTNPNNYGAFLDGPRSGLMGYPRDVLEFPVEPHTIHPTQKPVDLCRYLIEIYTEPGETVLDNCMGSGTTGVASVQSGRSFVGIESDEGYFRHAEARISSASRVADSNLDAWLEATL